MSDYSLWTTLFILELWKGALCFFVLGGLIETRPTLKKWYYNKGYVYNTFITVVKRRLKANENIKNNTLNVYSCYALSNATNS